MGLLCQRANAGLVKKNNISPISLQSSTAMSELTTRSSNLLALQLKGLFT